MKHVYFIYACSLFISLQPANCTIQDLSKETILFELLCFGCTAKQAELCQLKAEFVLKNSVISSAQGKRSAKSGSGKNKVSGSLSLDTAKTTIAMASRTTLEKIAYNSSKMEYKDIIGTIVQMAGISIEPADHNPLIEILKQYPVGYLKLACVANVQKTTTQPNESYANTCKKIITQIYEDDLKTVTFEQANHIYHNSFRALRILCFKEESVKKLVQLYGAIAQQLKLEFNPESLIMLKWARGILYDKNNQPIESKQLGIFKIDDKNGTIPFCFHNEALHQKRMKITTDKTIDEQTKTSAIAKVKQLHAQELHEKLIEIIPLLGQQFRAGRTDTLRSQFSLIETFATNLVEDEYFTSKQNATIKRLISVNRTDKDNYGL